MASLAFPQMSEAATRATGNGFRILSTTKKDTYDDDHIRKFPTKIN